MKESKYNKYFNFNGKKYVFNAMTTALADINENFERIIANIANLNPKELTNEEDIILVNNMILAGCIIDDDVNELDILKFRNNKGRFDASSLSLTIAPTLMCNFACPYCYETPVPGIMDEETQNALINFVKKQFENGIRKLSITWYGGEPLIAKDAIYNLSENFIKIVNEFNGSYDAFMVTNGYLFTDEIINKLKEYKVESFQITIDGPADIHNTRRKLKNSNGDTFYKIIENLKKLVENGLKPIVRINIDKTNHKKTYELLDYFKENNLMIPIDFAQVYDANQNSCSLLNHNCLTTEEYSYINYDLFTYSQNKGLIANTMSKYPIPKYNYCGADNINVFVVDVFGNLFKCWDEVGKKELAIDNIKNYEKFNFQYKKNYAKWFITNIFEDKDCIDCFYLPICMGGCPFLKDSNKKNHCVYWKYNLEKYLELVIPK